MRAALADKLVGEHAPEMAFDVVFVARPFNQVFESVHKDVEELIDVHLLEHVGRVAVPVFERKAEPFRVKVPLLRVGQSQE